MIEVSVLTSAFGFALGIADADRIGASAKVHAANPINKSRFMRFAPWIALSRRLIMHRHPDCSMDGTSIVQDRYAHRNGPGGDRVPRPLVLCSGPERNFQVPLFKNCTDPLILLSPPAGPCFLFFAKPSFSELVMPQQGGAQVVGNQVVGNIGMY